MKNSGNKISGKKSKTQKSVVCRRKREDATQRSYVTASYEDISCYMNYFYLFTNININNIISRSSGLIVYNRRTAYDVLLVQ